MNVYKLINKMIVAFRDVLTFGSIYPDVLAKMSKSYNPLLEGKIEW